MFCPQCGRQLLDDSVFCPECGERIVKSDSTAPKQPKSSQDYIIKKKNQIYLWMDPQKIGIYDMWVAFAANITFFIGLICLTFDIGRLREENVGLFLLSREDRLEEYMQIILDPRSTFTFRPWTKFFIISTIILTVVSLVLSWSIVWLKKRGREYNIDLIQEATITKVANISVPIFMLISLIVVVYVLI